MSASASALVLAAGIACIAPLSPSLSLSLFPSNVCNHVAADVAPAHVVAADEDDAAAAASATATAAAVYPTICV